MAQLAFENVTRAVKKCLPGRTVQSISDRGIWMRHIYEVQLDGGEIVFLKINVHPQSITDARHEARVAKLFKEYGLPAPQVLAVDLSGEIISQPYLIEYGLGGIRLGVLLGQVSHAESLAIYETLGKFYCQMHAIRHDRSGVWNEDPDQTLPTHPNDYMYRAEIVEGSGRRALELGRISQRSYDRIVELWADHLQELKAHQPSLIHGSPFWWNIYLERDGEGWRVVKLTSLDDVMWWDAAYDLAFLRFPPFGESDLQHWQAFLSGYGVPPEEKRLTLYLLMQRLCAAMGVYAEPASPENRAWAATCLEELDGILDQLSA